MPRSDVERIARLEEIVLNQSEQLKEVSVKLDKLQSSFDNLSGGKQALLWLAGFLSAVGLVVVGYVGLHRR